METSESLHGGNQPGFGGVGSIGRLPRHPGFQLPKMLAVTDQRLAIEVGQRDRHEVATAAVGSSELPVDPIQPRFVFGFRLNRGGTGPFSQTVKRLCSVFVEVRNSPEFCATKTAG